MLNNKLLNVLAIFALTSNGSPLPQNERDNFYKLANDQPQTYWTAHTSVGCKDVLDYLLDMNDNLLEEVREMIDLTGPEPQDETTRIDSTNIPINDLCVYKPIVAFNWDNSYNYVGTEWWYMI